MVSSNLQIDYDFQQCLIGIKRLSVPEKSFSTPLHQHHCLNREGSVHLSTLYSRNWDLSSRWHIYSLQLFSFTKSTIAVDEFSWVTAVGPDLVYRCCSPRYVDIWNILRWFPAHLHCKDCVFLLDLNSSVILLRSVCVSSRDWCSLKSQTFLKYSKKPVWNP